MVKSTKCNENEERYNDGEDEQSDPRPLNLASVRSVESSGDIARVLWWRERVELQAPSSPASFKLELDDSTVDRAWIWF